MRDGRNAVRGKVTRFRAAWVPHRPCVPMTPFRSPLVNSRIGQAVEPAIHWRPEEQRADPIRTLFGCTQPAVCVQFHWGDRLWSGNRESGSSAATGVVVLSSLSGRHQARGSAFGKVAWRTF